VTREEILNLEPGPELDWLVAEKVMGRKRTTKGALPGCAYWKDDDGFVRANETPGGSLNWNPSTDIAAAWEVVKEVRRKGWSLVLRWSARYDLCEVWMDDGARKVYAIEPEPTLAICRAALFTTVEAPHSKTKEEV